MKDRNKECTFDLKLICLSFQILFIYPYQERSRTPANSTSKAQAQIIISFFGRLYILVTKLLKAKK